MRNLLWWQYLSVLDLRDFIIPATFNSFVWNILQFELISIFYSDSFMRELRLIMHYLFWFFQFIVPDMFRESVLGRLHQ